LPAADDRAGLPQYSATVVRAIGNRDPKRVVLVAQSLAGFTLPLVCQEIQVAMLVLVNAMIPKPGETPGEWWGNTDHAEAKRQQNVRDGRRADAPFDPLSDFFHDVPQPVVDKAWAQGEPRQSDTVFGSRRGRTCRPTFSWGAMIGSFQRISNGGWRASVSECQRTRCPADISSP